MLKRIFTVTAVIISGLLFLSAGANADDTAPTGTFGTCTDIVVTKVCGHIYNDDNNQNLRITNDWGKHTDSATWRTLRVGQSSDDVGVKDADGFMIPQGCRGTVAFVQDHGPGWYKVRDGQHIHLTDIVC